jgi:hypothetical protein
MLIIDRKNIDNEEYELLEQYLKFNNKNLELNLINGYIKVKDCEIYYYKNVENNLYSLINNQISYLINIIEYQKQSKISIEDYDYLLMFIYRSDIVNKFEIGDLDEDGTIKILNIDSQQTGIIYKNIYNMYFYKYQNKSVLFSGTGVAFP